MAVSNRATILNKLNTVLKKQYKPVPHVENRTVLEHLLFAACLENSSYDKAEEGFARIQNTYYDWNEIRVTTVRELAESFDGIASPIDAAKNLKRTLQSVFESRYRFDLEDLKKQNLGKAVSLLEGYSGTSPFTVSFAVQHGLGGHSIPICRGSLEVMHIIGAISDAEFSKATVPGLERTISKPKGLEFGSMLHQLAAEFLASPFSPKVRAILLEIAPDAKDRLPKRKKPATAKAKGKTAEAKKKVAEKTPAKQKKKTATKATKTSAKAKKKAPAKGRKPATGKAKPRKVAKKKAGTGQLSRRKPR